MKKILIFLVYGILSVLVPLSQASAQEKKLSYGIAAGILSSDTYEDVFDESPFFIKGIVNYSVGQNFDIEASYLVVSESEISFQDSYVNSGGQTVSVSGTFTLNSSSLDLYGLYYVQPSLFLKGGFYSSSAKTASKGSRTETTSTTATTTLFSASTSASETGLLLGAGIQKGHWRVVATSYLDWFDENALTVSVGYLF